MKEERRTVLWLVAMGRISAAEAERLIAAWSADREVLWMAVVGIALVVTHGIMQGTAAGHLAHALAPLLHNMAQHTIAFLGKGLGGWS